ncbi:unnamed protein product [Rotaria sordida]|uniref:RRM domain-containing protein n=1 Tax=Rotaria sordida TaxID=392033 RepID=A0A815BX38_9BILA|nr:unnamed protein product [Rotaria sordida]CAF1277880.1 unnamed protein product [Rotaria sordida]CAF1556941.1 unnamed protein product [Rotaria sordida]CAF1557297.1 unnamed protein product [Rotaria sordida]
MANSDKLGLGLDDIIRLDRTTNRRGGGGRGGGGNRGFRVRTGRGSANGFRTRGGGALPRISNPSATGRWKHDLYDDNTNRNREIQRNTGVNSTTKLLISNLDFGVTTNDIIELFEDIGAVRVARVHFDETGRSLGTAEVIYERRADAITAQQKYNTLNLDGRPMDIRLVGNIDDGSKQQLNRFSLGNVGNNRPQRSGFRNTNQQNNIRGNRTRGGRQQQNGSSGKKEEVTAEDLDAELDAYRAESKQKK